jgi:RHS repeat-associated protein
MFKKLCITILLLFFCFPLFSFAQEIPKDQQNIIPVYFFLHHTETESLGILAITPIDEETFVWAYEPFENDDLSRLLSTTVSNSATSTSNYVQNFTYGPTGNILSGPLGAYSYAGNIGTNYANPHAATTIATSTLSYDQNGNLTNDGTLAYSWDYKDHMLSSANGTFTVSTYAYDRSGQRVKRISQGTTTIYPNKLYEVTGTTTTKYIFAGDMLVATIDKVGTSTSSYFIHTDHLGGTNIVTDEGANVVETLDYYSYGQTRLDDKATTFSEGRKYIGEYQDAQSGLSYLNARYYNGTQGRFVSEDPVFWEVGQSKEGKQALVNPQSQNSYGYAGGNPIKSSDPTGRAFVVDDAAGFGVGGLVGGGMYLLSIPVFQQSFSWSDFSGSVVTGGIIGWGAVNTPETLGASNAVSAAMVAGFTAGFYGRDKGDSHHCFLKHVV